MSHTVCCIKGCYSRLGRKPFVEFYKLPSNFKQLNSLQPLESLKCYEIQEAWYKALGVSENQIELLALHNNDFVCSQHFSQDDFVIDQSTGKRKLRASAVPRLNLPSSNKTDQDLVVHTSDGKEHFPYLTAFLQDDQLPDYVKDLYKNVYKCCKMVETSNNKPHQVENQQFEMPILDTEVETNNIDNQENVSPPNLILESSPDTNANKWLCLKKKIDAQPEQLVHLCKRMNNFDKKLEAIDRGLSECSEILNELD